MSLLYQSAVERINYNELKLEKVPIGQGAFGVVKKAIWRGIEVAVKEEAKEQSFISEVSQLSRAVHPNIIKLYGYCADEENPRCLVMEYSRDGSLYDVLHKDGKIPNYSGGHVVNWSIQCAKGVEYLHSMKPPMVHRDLKPANLLLFENGINLKICDFGTACPVRTYMTNTKGSVAWMAPEVFATNKYSEKCDVYSFGVILWEMITRQKPYQNSDKTHFAIMWAVHSGERPPFIADCPEALHNLVIQCWDGQPSKRPTFTSIIEILLKLQPLFPGGEIPLNYPISEFISGPSNVSNVTNCDKRFLRVKSQTCDIRNRYSADIDNLSNQPSIPNITNFKTHRRTGSYEVPSNTFDSNVVGDYIQNQSSGSLSLMSVSEADKEEIKSSLPTHLQPWEPDENCEESVKTYFEHLKLAKEYIKLLTKIEEMEAKKIKLQQELDAELRHQEENEKLAEQFGRIQSENEEMINQIRSIKDEVTRLQEREKELLKSQGYEVISSNGGSEIGNTNMIVEQTPMSSTHEISSESHAVLDCNELSRSGHYDDSHDVDNTPSCVLSTLPVFADNGSGSNNLRHRFHAKLDSSSSGAEISSSGNNSSEQSR